MVPGGCVSWHTTGFSYRIYPSYIDIAEIYSQCVCVCVCVCVFVCLQHKETDNLG